MAGALAFVFDAYGTLFDVMGAKAYGFHVAWVNRTHSQTDELGLAPDIVLSGLDELPHAFPAL
jgi:FMN phosphatase YigB (HAD superfamily)